MHSNPSPTSRELTEYVLRRAFMFSRPKLDEISRDHFEMEVNDAMSHGDVYLCVVEKYYGCSRDGLLALRDFMVPRDCITSMEYGLGKHPPTLIRSAFSFRQGYQRNFVTGNGQRHLIDHFPFERVTNINERTGKANETVV